MNAGLTGQGEKSIAIGQNAGQTALGTGSIAIGTNITARQANTIVLNAGATGLTGTTGSACYVAPIRGVTGTTASSGVSIVTYDPGTKELSYNPDITISTSNQIVSPSFYSITGQSATGGITVAETAWLNRKHTIFGEVKDEASKKVVDAIGAVKTGGQDRPVQAVKINTVTISE